MFVRQNALQSQLFFDMTRPLWDIERFNPELAQKKAEKFREIFQNMRQKMKISFLHFWKREVFLPLSDELLACVLVQYKLVDNMEEAMNLIPNIIGMPIPTKVDIGDWMSATEHWGYMIKKVEKYGVKGYVLSKYSYTPNLL
jgi:hypothetical protein